MSRSNVVSPTAQNDLREFIAVAEQRGELARVDGAHWDKEIGAVTEVLYRQKVEKSPMLLFDGIPGYAKGYRCTYGMFGSPFRLATVLGEGPTGVVHRCTSSGRRAGRSRPSSTSPAPARTPTLRPWRSIPSAVPRPCGRARAWSSRGS